MTKEGMEIIAFTTWLVDQWYIWILYAISVIYLIYQKKKYLFSDYAKIAIVSTLIVFNPLFCGFIVRYFFTYTRYFRILWLMPVYCVIAIAATDFCSSRRKFSVVMCAIMIYVTGKFEFTGNFSFAENIYKLPQEVVEICEYFKQTEEYSNGQLKISAEPYLSTFIRQYDSRIRLQFGRSSTVYTESAEAEVAFVQIGIEQGKERDLYLLTKALRNDSCRYLVIEAEKVTDEEMQAYGYAYTDTVCGYEIYQDMWYFDVPGVENASNGSVILDIQDGMMIEYLKHPDGSPYKVRYVLDEYDGSFHKVIYDKETQLFYVLDKEKSKILLVHESNGSIRIIDHRQIATKEIKDIEIQNGYFVLYLNSGETVMLEYKDRSFSVPEP